MLDPNIVFMVFSAQVYTLLTLKKVRAMQIKVNADAR